MSKESNYNSVSRRGFIKMSSVTAIGAPFVSTGFFETEKVAIILDPADSIVHKAAAQWAIQELQTSLTLKGISVTRREQLGQTQKGELCIFISAASTPSAEQLLNASGITIPAVDEAVALVPVKLKGKQIVIASGNEQRGIIYAVLELADRINNGSPTASLVPQKPVIEKPANSIRSLTRLFCSEIEDKGWYNDKEMWPPYLSMLATQRFNRFNLSLGIGYDFLRNVTDAYFLFAYPFFLAVPGYNVKADKLPDTERDNNLAMLKFISEQTVARGMQFQLGLWMHGFEWLNSPNPNYTITGLTAENHGPYCRDAVRALLQACPAISGVTFRVHGESGVNEGSYKFWQTVFEGVKTCGRKVEIDMHSKGIDQAMIDSAVATGLPVVISPKYWAEHLGMPYHQADIRKLEIPDPAKKTSVLMNLSEGSRSFMRYGYGDLLKEDRPYKVLHRIWPGTQRLLLWGDPVTGAAHSKAFSFSGSAGVELMEPLSFKGRRGSGIAGSRIGYSDLSLNPRWDWEKYLYTLRVFGRLMYNPESDADVWKRFLRKQFGPAAAATEMALSNATRILPIVLTAHGTSAGNNTYWPEMYTNQPIVDPTRNNNMTHLYDTPAPKVFGNVSPLDPQLFLTINEYAGELLKGETSGKYTPVETAQWLEDLANDAKKYLKQAEEKSAKRKDPEFRRMQIDVSMQAGLGLFFAAKFRSAVLYELFIQTGNRLALEEAIKRYQLARNYWADVANLAKDVYKADITIGERAFLRGHWLDRIPAIDEDIADMSKKLEGATGDGSAQNVRLQTAIHEVLGRPERPLAGGRHITPDQFNKGREIPIEVSFEKIPEKVTLYYRHTTQAERYEELDMTLIGNSFKASIPADYTNSPYPIQYYFVFKDGQKSAGLYPGFKADLASQPYFHLRQT